MRIAAALAGLLLVSGCAGMMAVRGGSARESAQIKPGGGHAWKFDVPRATQGTLDFTATGPIDVFIVTEADYKKWTGTGSSSGVNFLASSRGAASGQLTASVTAQRHVVMFQNPGSTTVGVSWVGTQR